MAAVEGTLFSGWLYKKKSEGSKTKFIGGHNKRYFTLDFASEVFFYAHSDKEKKVSAPVAFTDLLEVKAQPPKKASFGLMGREAMPFSLCLHTFGKEVWLFSSDEMQISAWGSQLSRAIAIGKERRDSRCQSRASAVSASTLSASTAVPGSGQITPQEVSRGATPDAMMVAPSGPPAPVMAPPERMVEPAFLQDSPTQPEPAQQAQQAQPEGWAAKPQGAPYDDKSAGLSLHERLAQLQFSDSESDEDDEQQDPNALVASVLDGVDDVDRMPAGYGTADARPRPRDGALEAPAPEAPAPEAEAPTVTVALVEQPPSPPPAVESWDSPSPQKEPLVMRESSWDEPAPHAGALQATQANDMVVRESSWDNPSPVAMRESSWDK